MSTPTTRELLEGAAKAAGWTVVRWADDGSGLLLEGIQEPWNPITNMADCFEMETALLLDIEWTEDELYAITNDAKVCERFRDHNNDRKAARMYASTRCAFEIGKGMR